MNQRAQELHLEAVQQRRWRQAPFGSRPQTIVVTTGRRARCVRVKLRRASSPRQGPRGPSVQAPRR